MNNRRFFTPLETPRVAGSGLAFAALMLFLLATSSQLLGQSKPYKAPRSTGTAHSSKQPPHSLPSDAVPAALGSSSSSRRELDRLEHQSSAQARAPRTAHPSTSAPKRISPSSPRHNAPIVASSHKTATTYSGPSRPRTH